MPGQFICPGVVIIGSDSTEQQCMCYVAIPINSLPVSTLTFFKIAGTTILKNVSHLEAVLKLFFEGLRGKNFRFDRGFGEDSCAYLT